MKDPRHSLPPGSMVVFVAVALGAWIRFTGIGWGLSHPPHSDEQAYVESVNAMLDAAISTIAITTTPACSSTSWPR